MTLTVKERFLLNNEMVNEPPTECDLKVGDIVTFTNEYGVSFPNNVVIGFAKLENQNQGRFIHLNHDSAWFPVTRESLTLQNPNPIIQTVDVYVKIDHPSFGILDIDQLQRRSDFIKTLKAGDKFRFWGEDRTIDRIEHFSEDSIGDSVKVLEHYQVFVDWTGK